MTCVAHLLLDFDNVVNVEGIAKPKNRGKLPPLGERFTGLTHGFVHVTEGSVIQRYNISHHTEVIDFIGGLVDRGVQPIWLTTWERDAFLTLNPYLGTDFPYIPWVTQVGGSPGYMAAARAGSQARDDYVTSVRDARKLARVKAFTAETGKPFIWIDDTAALLHDPDDFSVPSLAVVPNPLYGIDRKDAETVTAFLDGLDA